MSYYYTKTKYMYKSITSNTKDLILLEYRTLLFANQKLKEQNGDSIKTR